MFQLFSDDQAEGGSASASRVSANASVRDTNPQLEVVNERRGIEDGTTFTALVRDKKLVVE